MKNGVIAITHHLKIFRSVIEGILIDVMDVLVLFKLASQSLFGNPAMFSDPALGRLDNEVLEIPNVFGTSGANLFFRSVLLPSISAGTRTKFLIQMAVLASKSFATMLADPNYWRLGLGHNTTITQGTIRCQEKPKEQLKESV